jgi:hypothetical protein
MDYERGTSVDHHEDPSVAKKHKDTVLDMWCTATAYDDIADESVTCALPKHFGNAHARGFLMWEYWGEYSFYWCSVRQYDEDGNYVFPGDSRWNG